MKHTSPVTFIFSEGVVVDPIIVYVIIKTFLIACASFYSSSSFNISIYKVEIMVIVRTAITHFVCPAS